MKNYIKAVVFICLLIICLSFVQDKLGYSDELRTQKIFENFYNLEEDSIDVICLGTSAVQRGWLTPVAFRKSGISSYTLATASQPFCLTRYLMEEAQKTQNPKVFIIDIRAAIETPDDLREGFIRRITDSMKDSPLRIKTVRNTLNYAKKGKNSIDTSDISYYFRLAKYHELYDSTKRAEEKDVKYYNGFAYYEGAYYKMEQQKDVGLVRKKRPLDERSIEMINDLLDYCDTIEADTVFTIIPFAGSVKELRKINSVKSIIRKRGYKCINFLDARHRKAIGVDFNTFFYNDRHTNYYGSEKYTKYMCEYLKKKYDISNRKGDPKCRKLARSSRKFIKKTKAKKEEMYSKITLK